MHVQPPCKPQGSDYQPVSRETLGIIARSQQMYVL